ncbi:MFS transporter [Ectobacillus antri]|uniref:MFS transporter n=1 Tax=Ectobacillus antri TaxID=2486280 RepID=A0ABT6H3S8_9BACI|nr:MFS transporter [Ectobacillus antri]MDG4656934.1 MFS transporter [Ectobacillus antri]MDG5754036.1 MFS transporter [Ectobacillus antri]
MKNKLYYLMGFGISGFGDGIQQIAIMWYVYHLTSEPFSIGFMIAIYYVPSIFLTPFVSVYVDHRNSKQIVVIMDFIRFFIVGILAISIYYEIRSASVIYMLQFLLAVCYTIYKPASQSFIKEAFSQYDIPFIVSKSAALGEAALITGSGFSGILLIHVSMPLCFLLNAITFLCASILYAQVVLCYAKQTTSVPISYSSSLKEGLLYVHHTRGMKYLLFLSILNSISIQMTTTLLLPLVKEQGGGSDLYALLDISFAVGGILAGITVTFFLNRFRHRAIVFTMSGMMLTSLLLAVTQYLFLIPIFIFALGLFTMSHLIATQTLIQLSASKEYIGRVVGIRTILASSIKIGAALATGFLVSHIGVYHLFLSFSMIMLFSFFTLRYMKHVSIPK